MVWARTRWLAALGALALVGSIQLAAREMGFAFLFANLLLLFTVRGNVWAFRVLAPVYVYTVGAVAGVLPGGELLDPGWL